MFKMLKKILIALGIIFFLFCIMVLLIRVDVIKLPTDSGNKVFNIAAEKMQKIEISNEKGDYTILINGEDVKVEGYEDFEYDSEIISGVVEYCRKIYAYDIIEKDSQDLSIYGLDNPQMSATITAEDEVHTVYVGDMMPNNNSYYISIDNENTVYAVKDDYLFYYEQDEYKYLSKQLNLLKEAETEYMIDNFSLTREGKPVFEFRAFTEEEKAFNNIANLYKITYPYTAIAKDARIVEYLNSIVTLKCARIEATEVNDEVLKEHDLYDPYYLISYTYFDEEYNIRISKPESSVSKLYVEGTDIIYAFVAQKINLLNFDIFNLINPNQFSRNISIVERIIFDIDGNEEVYNITSNDNSISGVNCNGNKIDIELFKKLYSVITTSRIDGVVEDEANEKPYITVTFKYQQSSGYKNDVISFHEINSSQYLLKINGEGEFYVSSVYVDKIIDSVNKTNSGTDFDIKW